MHIFGLHEPGGENLIRAAGRTGWLVFTEAVGSDPADLRGKDFRTWAGNGISAIVRLNNGYEPGGTIPHSSQYADFARRCAHYVANSHGANKWVIGNEMNHCVERPGGPNGQVITPALYASCFSMCRDAIRAITPSAEVIVGAVAPWNAETKYPGNERGDWVQYLEDILGLIANRCDGVAIHTYTHGADPALITSDAMMDPPFQDRYYNFFAYLDFCSVIPARLPVYITEVDQDVPWLDQNAGWVQTAYKEINTYNQAGDAGDPQQIHCLVLYRWPRIDPWYIDGKNGVIADFKAALQHDYQVRGFPIETGEIGTILVPTNLRQSPGYQNKPADDILTILQPGTKVGVGEGPVLEDGLEWYYVNGKSGAGWVAQTDPSGVVLLQLPGDPSVVDIAALAARYGLDPKVVEAVLAIESGGQSFGDDGKMIIRFETHIYESELNQPATFNRLFRYGSPRWKDQQWRQHESHPWRDVHTGRQSSEWQCFTYAEQIRRQAARMSISMGAPQIMGFNHAMCGYQSVDAMYLAFSRSAQAQIEGFFTYCVNSGAMAKLKEGDYLGFAKIYNGTGQAQHYADLIKGQIDRG